MAGLGLAWLGLAVGSRTDLTIVKRANLVKEVRQEDNIFIVSFSP
jgi:hypothetical protein